MEQIEKIRQSGSSWLGPMREFVDRALQSRKIARAKNTKEDLAIFAKTVGSDFFLTDLQLFPTYNLGFATLQTISDLQNQTLGTSKNSLSVSRPGIEPGTYSLRGNCSTN